MIDLPLMGLLDNHRCVIWRGRHLHPVACTHSHGGSRDRRLVRQQHSLLASGCRAGDGADTLFTGTAVEQTGQPPAAHVLLLRGTAKGESTAHLARALGQSWQHAVPQARPLRQRVETTNLNEERTP